MNMTVDLEGFEEADLDMDSVKGWELPPAGTYECELTLSVKLINEEKKVEWKYEIVDAEDEVLIGNTFNELMGIKPIKNKDTGKVTDPRVFFKKKATILSKALDIPNKIGDLVEAVQNVRVSCYLDHRVVKANGTETAYAAVRDVGFEVL